MQLFDTIFFALVGGILPSLVWLFYWLKEDKKHPEPQYLILLSFVFGMLAVPIAFVFQWFFNALLLKGVSIEIAFENSYWYAIVVLVLWAAIEEVLKYLAAHNAALKKKANDEPIDVIIYLITAALGFSALENVLFIFSPLLEGDIVGALITSNLRFVGATLLHISSSAIVGIFLAFSFYKTKKIQMRRLFTGFVFAVALHTVFNSFIIRAEKFTLIGLITVWIVIIAIILILEKVKKIYKPKVT